MHWFIAILSRRYQVQLPFGPPKDLAHLLGRRFARRCMNVTAEPNGQDKRRGSRTARASERVKWHWTLAKSGPATNNKPEDGEPQKAYQRNQRTLAINNGGVPGHQSFHIPWLSLPDRPAYGDLKKMPPRGEKKWKVVEPECYWLTKIN